MRNHANFLEACANVVPDSPVPYEFRLWAAISAVSGALGRSVWLNRGAFRVYPNQYIALVAGPGTGKTVSLQLPFNGIFGAISVPLGSGPTSSTWTREWENHEMPFPRRLSTARITAEKMAVDMSAINQRDDLLTTFDTAHYDGSTTVITAEMGSFLQRDDKNLQFLLTDLWDSLEKYEYRTKTSGQFLIRGPCLNWVICATPSQFVENLPQNAGDQGLLSRIVPVLYDGERLPQRLEYPAPAEQAIQWLRQDLADIAKLRGAFQWATTEEKMWVADWVENEFEKSNPTAPSMGGYNERRLAHLCKVAMAVGAATSTNGRPTLTRSSWLTAFDILTAAEQNMPRLLGSFGMSEIGRTTYDLAEMVKSVFKLSGAGLPLDVFNREIIRRARNASDLRNISDAMEAAGLIVKRGLIVMPSEAAKKEVNKP